MVFEVNGIYACFDGKGERFKVVDRSKSFVTVVNKYGEKIRRKVAIIEDCEMFYPYEDRRMYGSRVEDILKASSRIGG